VTVIGSLALERTVELITNKIRNWRQRIGSIRTTITLGGIGVLLIGMLLIAEIGIRIFAPQEVLGWGERPSLVSNEEFGWTLKPSSTTRLQWESYDYTVFANSLGFPGPDYSEKKNEHTLRIFVIGDAFTSAEGVDTQEAWPRLLEDELDRQLSGNSVEVMNFAITGYGPNQYLAVIDKFAPIYRPEWIIIGMFVNDLYDVQVSNSAFQASIGFENPSQTSVRSFMSLQHLRRYLDLQIAEPIMEIMLDEPREQGYFLGNFNAFERAENENLKAGQALVEERLRSIRSTADRIGAKLIILLIPSSIQVCSPESLNYFPKTTDLGDSTLYDLDQPQRLLSAAAAQNGLEIIDLRGILGGATQCPYHARNMHWNEDGHARVAEYLAGYLTNVEKIGSN
jgi:lysophospholipase L1-like esterase